MGKAEDAAIAAQVPGERLPLLGRAEPSLTYLSQGEVAHQASLAPWPGLRKALGGLLVSLFGCLLVMAVVLLVTLPRPQPPLPWWQKAAFYHLPPSSFPDSDGDGYGDFEGVRHQLDQLLAFSVQALVLGPIIVGDAANLSRVLPAHGSPEQLQGLLDDGRKRGVRILLEFPVWDEAPGASSPHNQTSQHIKEAMQFWQAQGVSGFVVGKEPAGQLDQVLSAWSELDSQNRADRGQERLLMVWDKSDTCSISGQAPSSVILACRLLGAEEDPGARELVQRVELALRRSQIAWPGWTVPSGVPPIPGLGGILGVLQFTLPGVPLLHGGEGSPIPLPREMTGGSANGHPLANLYRSLLALHAKTFSLHGVDFAPLPLPKGVKDVFAFLRPGSCSGVLVVLNLGRQHRQLSPNQLGIPVHAQVLFNTHLEPQKEINTDTLTLAPHQALLLRMPGGRGQ